MTYKIIGKYIKELKFKLLEQNSIKEKKIQSLESKLNFAEEQKLNALNELNNQSKSKINLLNNELNKLREDIAKQSIISELSLKNKVNEAVTTLEKENSSLKNSIEKFRLEQSKKQKAKRKNKEIRRPRKK